MLVPNANECNITISALTSRKVELPEDLELVSGLYQIDSSQKFTEPVTIKIQHCATKSCLNDLYFATSSDINPPYEFNYINSNFYSEFGEINVCSFSKFGIFRKIFIRSRGALEHSQPIEASRFNGVLYTAYLFHTEKYERNFTSCWDLSFYVVRKLEIYESLVKHYAAEAELKPSGSCTVEIKINTEVVYFGPDDIEKYPNIRVINVVNPSLSKAVIDSYEEGQPPCCQIQLRNSNNDSQFIEVQFNMTGFKEPLKYINFIWPPLCELLHES